MHTRGHPDYSHEHCSQLFFEHIVDTKNLDVSSKEVKFVQNLISGTPSPNEERKFLYQVVSNPFNSIDVDKWDYLQRDPFYAGFTMSYNCERIMNVAKVLDNEICFYRTDYLNIYKLFDTRMLLFRQMYLHKSVVAVDLMFEDILDSIDYEMGISKAALMTTQGDLSQIGVLNDSMISNVVQSYNAKPEQKELLNAKSLLKRVMCRQLYRLAFETVMSHEQLSFYGGSDGIRSLISNQLIINHQYFRICVDRMNHALGTKNPMLHTKFFDDWKQSKGEIVGEHEISNFIPPMFSEYLIRVFVTEDSFKEQVKDSCGKILKLK